MDAVFATRRIGTDAVFARLFFSATEAYALGGTGTSTGSGSGGTATGVTAGSGNAPGGTGTSTGSGSGGAASGVVAGSAPGGVGTSTGSGSGGAATGMAGGDASAPGGTGVSTGSGAGGTASGEWGFSGSLSDADIARIAAAVIAALSATVIPVNTVQMNGAPIAGDGSEANRWRGVGVPN